MSQQRIERARGEGQSQATDLHARHRGANLPLWLTSSEAAAYIGNRSVRAFYDWRKRHGLFTDGRGRVSRIDLDRALRVPRKRHVMSPRSLANLRRHGSQSAPVTSALSACER